MAVDITFTQLIGVMVFFLLALAAIGKLIFAQMQNYIGSSLKLVSDRMEAMESSNTEEREQWKRIERDLNDLQKDLPLHYVRREDYIRGQSVLEAKMDSLGNKLENVQLRAMIGAKRNES
jgi:hypothetical protein